MGRKLMDKKVSDKTLAYYTNTVKEHPETVQGLDWGTEYSQQIRFTMILEGIKNRNPEDTILDVGCGYGDLSEKVEWTSHYTGIDLNPHMIEIAHKHYPKADIRLADLSDVHETYDWVVASGAFSVKNENNKKYLEDSIRAMWDLCKQGVAFNILITGSDITNDDMWFYEPGEVLAFCRSLTPWMNCRMDYLPHDATFHLYREQVT